MKGIQPSKFIIWIVLSSMAIAASAPVYWSSTNLIFSGQIRFYMSALIKIRTVSDTYPNSFNTTPNRAMGYVNLNSGSEDRFDTFVAASSVNSTSLSLLCTIDLTMSVSQFFINYLVVDQSLTAFDANNGVDLLFLASQRKIASGSGIRQTTAVVNFTYWTGQVLNPSNSNKILVFIQGITMYRGSLTGDFNLTVTSSVLNANQYQITVSTSQRCTITQFVFSRVIFDQTALQSTKQIFVDSEMLVAVSSAWSALNINLVWTSSDNFLVGLSGITYAWNVGLNFKLGVNSFGSMSFKRIQISYFNYRIRNCPSSHPFFLDSTNLCYDICEPYYTSSTDNNVCLPCLSSCYSCLNTSTSTCLSCNPQDNRTLVSGSCVCMPSTFETGSKACASCNYTCGVCTNLSSCVSCDAAHYRGYSSGQCPCVKGYYDNGVALCASCGAAMTGCSACSSSTTCTECNGVEKFVLSGGVCVCATGYVLSGTSCVPCSNTMTGCVSCSSSSVCTSCDPLGHFTLLGTVCGCSEGYYSSGTTCVACLLGCLACTGPTLCTTCLSNMNFNGTDCVCDSGYIWGGSSCKLCSTFIYGCEYCSSTTVCTGCSNVPQLALSAGVCNCTVSYTYSLTTQTCQSCSTCCSYGQYLDSVSTCQACSGLASNCQACNSTACLICLRGYYLSSSSCVPCNSSLQGCLECDSSSTCTLCDASSHFTLASGMCFCSVGYTFNVGTCQACSSLMAGCLTCPTTDNCTMCDSNFNFLLTDDMKCVCPVGMFVNGTFCSMCIAAIPGCLECSSEATCTLCDSLLTLTLDASGNNCVCLTGFYLDGACKPCSAAIVGCTQCSDNSTCTVCDSSANFQLVGSICSCPPVHFLDFSAGCMACDLGCESCSANSSNCQTCVSPRVLSGTSCECPFQTYILGATCGNCDAACSSCTGPAISECTDCVSPYTLVGTTCQCGSSGYIDVANSVCTPCHSSCQTCDGSTNTSCLTCDSSQFRDLVGTSCPCTLPYMEFADGCRTSKCLAGYTENPQTGNCEEICGDGVKVTEECDDGNNQSGDGCSSSCKIEQNYTCLGGSTTSPSQCSYNKPLSIVLIDSWKMPTSNTVYFSFSITPAIPALDTLSFSDSLSCTLPNSTLSTNYSSGQLLIEVNYTSTIQSAEANLSFFPSVSGAIFFATPDTVTPFTVDPNNNLAAVYYEDAVYSEVETTQKVAYATAGLGYAGFAAGMVVGRYIGVEMIGVLQVAFVGLIVVDYLQPLLATMTKVGFVNGVNSLFADQRQALLVNGDLTANSAPKSAIALSYDAQMIYSLNYSILLLLLPPIIALILFIASKICKTKEKKEKLAEYSWIALCDFGLSAVVFLIYHIVVSLLIWAIYSKQQGTLFPFSIADAVISMSVAIVLMVLFKMKPQHFGDFKTAFKSDNLSQSHYYLLIGSRIILSILLVGTNSTVASGFICAILPVLSIIYLGIRKPYSQNYNNFRAILNSSAQFLILTIYGYYRCFVSYNDSFTGLNAFLPYVVIALLLLTILVNTAAIVKLALDKCKKKKQAKDLQESLFKAEEEQNKLYVAGMMKEMAKFAQKKGPQVRQIIPGQSFNPEKFEMSRMDKDYSSQLSIKNMNQQLMKKKKIMVSQKKFEESRVFTKQEIEQVHDDFDAI